MAARHGKNAAVWFNATDVTGYLDSASLSVDVETADSTVFGLGFKTAINGLISSTFSSTGKYDPTYQTIRDFLGTGSGVLSYMPGGKNIGDPARLIPITLTSHVESSPVGDIVAFSWDAMSDASVGAGWVLNEGDEQTNSGAGTGADGAAQTSTGWTAHLHVFAVDGGSWVISLADSTDNSSFSALASSSFTAATGATYQRLQSPSSTTTVKRYVRYGATRTGGTAGDGITFGLTFSRSY